jgi:hypothetical protein
MTCICTGLAAAYHFNRSYNNLCNAGSLMVGAGKENSFGTEVAPGLLAHHHQHVRSS